jgi:hypothetical protein
MLYQAVCYIRSSRLLTIMISRKALWSEKEFTLNSSLFKDHCISLIRWQTFQSVLGLGTLVIKNMWSVRD